MNLIPLNAQLRRGCDALDLSFDVAAELLSYLEIGKLLSESRESFSPSAKIDKLLHWILLNTEARKVVEQYMGTIYHNTETASLSEEEKCLRRLQTLNVLAEQGWTPKLAVWEEPQTLMHKITMVELYGTSGESPGKKFRMYRANRHGLDEILKKMWEHKCSAGEPEAGDISSGVVESQQAAKRQKTEGLSVDEKGKLSINVNFQTGETVRFLISGSTRVSMVLDACIKRMGCNPKSIKFITPDGRLDPHETFQHYFDLGYDVKAIDVMISQSGC